MIVLNKIDRVRLDQRNQCVRLIKALNPTAQLVEVSFGQAPLYTILNTGSFDFERAQRAPRSFVYRARQLLRLCLTARTNTLDFDTLLIRCKTRIPRFL